MLIDLKNHKSYLDLSEMKVLISFLKDNTCDVGQIKNYFSENLRIVRDLEDTLALLTCIDVIKTKADGNIGLIENTFDNQFNYFILKNVFNYLNKYKVAVFNKDSNGYSIFLNHYYYAIRNFLIASDAIVLLNNSNYKVHKNYEALFGFLIKNKVSLNQLKRDLEYKEILGTRAELYVIDYERMKYPSKSIDYVSPDDVSAGYDIKSYINNNSITFDKFIEVKCISIKDRFYLSRNELEVSNQLGDNYYLYLVKSSFDTPPIEIKNPYKNIYLNKRIVYTEESISFNVSSVIESLLP
jgi:hypothetical protein